MNKRSNWGNRNIWFPREVIAPNSLEELRDAILMAKANHRKVRMAGAFHSLNALASTDDLQIQMDQLSAVIAIDKSQLRVKTQGGIIIRKLLEAIAKEGLTLPNQGYIMDQTIGGAIATATHGSGGTGTLSSFVEEIELLDANGTLHTLSPSLNPHLFSAAVVHLGCLGIVYSLTLRCVPLEKLHLSKVRGDLATTLKQLPELLKQNAYFQFILDPYSDQVLSWRYQQTDAPLSHRFSYNMHWLLVKTLAFFSFDVMASPWWFMPTMIKIYMAVSPFKSCVDYSNKLLSPADEGHYIEEEIAVPVEHLEKALAATRQIIDRFSSEKKRMVAVILIRFAEADPYGYLSPAYGRKSAYISLITIAKQGYEELFHEIEEALYVFEGRPHWGKAHSLTKERIAQLYGSGYTRFLEARAQLDPDSLFSNAYIQRLF